MLGNPSEHLKKLIKDGEILEKEALANAFNDFFLSVPTISTNTERLRYLNCSVENTIYLDPVAENEVIAAFMSLSNSNSSDVDGFQIKPVKFVIDLLA